MFEPTDIPRLFGIPPGADFPAYLVQEILSRHANRPPEDLARLRILVNTRRMQRRLKMLFSKDAARLLPRIGLVTEVDALMLDADLPAAVTPLRRRLEMAELVKALIARDASLAPRPAAVDLADSLAMLLDEMQSEGVPPDRFASVDIGDDSMHWQRSLTFLGIANTYLENIADFGIDTEARRRAAIALLCRRWLENPPAYPVIVAGSTGSRSATAMLMRCVAKLPQGALVLPGFDFDLPATIWDNLTDDGGIEDHPQYRFAALLASLNMTPENVVRWGDAPDHGRNRLISLSLRPARVTDQWLTEGPELGDLVTATSGLTLIEAPQPANEALAIAVALREAVEGNTRAALITPDRTLTRRVAAALARWSITPDDSAGVPLSLTPPGRFMRQIVRLVGQPATPEGLISLLKHPLTRSGDGVRGAHMLATQALEVFLRNKGVVVVTSRTLAGFAGENADHRDWADWLNGLLGALSVQPDQRLHDMASRHIELADIVSKGPVGQTAKLWDGSTGRAVRAELDRFVSEGDFAGAVTLSDYSRLLEMALASESNRVPEGVHPDVMIWGTLEARVQGADLVILGGLNDGVWPEQPGPDPWLNRRMRRQLGLLLPDRQIGLAAHDYQQAVAADRVILVRAARDEESETVPSRWLNRLTNLLGGLPEQGGKTALEAMRARGQRYLALAERLDAPEDAPRQPTRRPAPSPPPAVRPKRLSVTEISTLIRDPYAIYARRILELEPLPPLIPLPDARMKGIVFHDILEEFFSLDAPFSDPEDEHARLRSIAAAKLDELVPWPSVRSHWFGHLASIADWLIASETDRLRLAAPLARECKGSFVVPGTAIALRGKADRIDRLHQGGLVIYDYKTGKPPSRKEVRAFDRQLLIEAVMAEEGAFADIAPQHVAHVAHIGVGRTPEFNLINLQDDGEDDFRTVTVARQLALLLNSFASADTGYISRRAMESVRYDGEYDHLARFGEWNESDTTTPERF